jgi:hypothetical protein
VRSQILADAARVYGACLALIGLAALALFASPASARALMPLGFGHITRGIGTVTGLALANARVALVPLALATLAHHGRPLRRLGDGLLIALATLNAAEVGAALAGYGWRTVVALAPHALVELAGYAVAGAAYLAGRRAPLTALAAARCAAVCAGLLLAAAVLETYVQLRPR